MTGPPATQAPTLSNSGSSFSDRTVDEEPRELKRQRTPRKPAGGPARQPSGGAAGQERTCRVPGCTAELAPGYNQKYRICATHYAAPIITVGADRCRFCQQCSRIHAVEEFDTDRRSCRASLERHQQARTLRKRRSQSRHSGQGQRSSQRQRRAQPAPEEQQPEGQLAAHEQHVQHGPRLEAQAGPQSLQAQQRERRQQAGPHLLRAVGSAELLPSPRHMLHPGSQDVIAGAALSAHASSSTAGALECEQQQQQQQQQQQAAAMPPWVHPPVSAPGAPLPPASLAAVSAARGSGPLPLQAQLQHQLLQLQQSVLQWQAADMQHERQPQADGVLPPRRTASASLHLGARCWQEASVLQHAMLWSATTFSRGGSVETAPAPHREMVQQAMELLQLDMPTSDYVPSERELEHLNHQLGHRQRPPFGAHAATLGASRALPIPSVRGPCRQDLASLGGLAAPMAGLGTEVEAAQPEVQAPPPHHLPEALAASGSAASASLPSPELPASACTARPSPAACLAEVEVGILQMQHAQQAQQQLLGSGALASQRALPPLPALSAASAVPLPAGAPLTGPEAADWLSQFLL